MDATEREVGRFEAEDDKGGRYTVVEWQLITFFRPLSGPTQEVPVVIRLELITGEHVNPRDDGTFQVFDDDTIIRKIK